MQKVFFASEILISNSMSKTIPKRNNAKLQMGLPQLTGAVQSLPRGDGMLTLQPRGEGDGPLQVRTAIPQQLLEEEVRGQTQPRCSAALGQCCWVLWLCLELLLTSSDTPAAGSRDGACHPSSLRKNRFRPHAQDRRLPETYWAFQGP